MTLVSVEVSPILWSDADFTWDEIDSNKTWDTSYVYDYALSLEESATFLDESIIGKILSLSESFGFSDTHKKDITKNLEVALNISENLKNTASFIRRFSESFTVQEEQNKTISKNILQTLSIVDNWFKKANAIISDLVILSSSYGETDFVNNLEKGSPLGFDSFKSFINGNHRYSEAIFRYVLRDPTNTPEIKELELFIDVPDVTDKGTGNVSSSSYTTINFNRIYSVPPEIVAMQKSGAVIARPDITNITVSGFDAALLDSSGTKINGSITWSSNGY